MDEDKKVAVLSVDPSSPFNYGALLGDRIRMSEFYLNPNVYIRSLASRGSLGGLSTKIIEILDVLKSCPFNIILIETVGVGQSEVEISGLADTTIVVTVPEAGDEVQTMKAGVMEIADIFVVNKGDRENADSFVKAFEKWLPEPGEVCTGLIRRSIRGHRRKGSPAHRACAAAAAIQARRGHAGRPGSRPKRGSPAPPTGTRGRAHREHRCRPAPKQDCLQSGPHGAPAVICEPVQFDPRSEQIIAARKPSIRHDDPGSPPQSPRDSRPRHQLRSRDVPSV